jgi:Protein of unknown function (DUF2917)
MDRPIEEYLDREELFIPSGSMLRIDEGRGTLLRVSLGAVWITQEGDARDIFREANQSFLLDRGGATIVYACRHTLLTLTATALEPKRIRVIHPKASNDEHGTVAA